MTQDMEGMRDMTYECANCGLKIKGEELVMRNRIVCPRCNYKVLKKVRPPISKRVKAV